MIDGIAHSLNSRLLCVYYTRQLMTIMLTSLGIGMRIMEEREYKGKIAEIRVVLVLSF